MPNYLTLVSKATEIVIDGHTFKKSKDGWQIWVNSTRLVFKELVKNSLNKSTFKIGLRQNLPKQTETENFYAKSLTEAYSWAVSLNTENCENCGQELEQNYNYKLCEKCR